MTPEEEQILQNLQPSPQRDQPANPKRRARRPRNGPGGEGDGKPRKKGWRTRGPESEVTVTALPSAKTVRARAIREARVRGVDQPEFVTDRPGCVEFYVTDPPRGRSA